MVGAFDFELRELAKMSTIALNRFGSVVGGQYGSKFGQLCTSEWAERNLLSKISTSCCSLRSLNSLPKPCT